MSAAVGPSAASETTCLAARTASPATSTQRAASAMSIRVRGPSRSASIPPAGISAVRGTP
jgi:hypothetical protein